MSKISTSVPNLINGVSQQPASLRYPSQCEEQINALSSVTEGLIKRPPTNHIARLIENFSGDALIHTINRDVSERYVVVVESGAVKVFDTELGEEQTVTTSTSAASYLTCGDPRADLKAVTVADYTFLLNRTQTVAMASDLSYDPRHKAFVTVVQGDYEKDYTITMGKGITSGTKSLVSFTLSGTGKDFKIEAKDNGTALNGVTVEVTQGGARPRTFTPYLETTYNSVSRRLTITWNHSTPTPNSIAAAIAATNSTKDLFTVANINGETGTASLNIYDLDSINNSVFAGGTASYTAVQSYTYTSPSTATPAGIQTDAIAEELYDLLTDGATGLNGAAVDGYTSWVVSRSGSVLRINRTDDGEFPITTTDSLSDTAMTLVKGSADRISSLPLTCTHRFLTKIEGLADEAGDDYWVQFIGKNGGTDQYDVFDKGSWSEGLYPNITYRLDATTLPHVLVRQSDGTWTCDVAGWTDRSVGDEETNPNPSFVGQPLNDVFFFRNRLGFLAGENVILSEAGNPFNFFRTTVVSLLDSDPIDVGTSHTKVAILYHAVPFNERLVLFSEQTQFVLTGGDILTPKTVAITQSSEYSTMVDLRPVPAGSSIFFGFQRGTFNGVMEYTLDPESTAEKFKGDEVTAHIPKYIDETLYKLAVADNENMLVALSDGLTNGLYIYKWFTQEGQRLQSSWSQWTLNDNAEIVGAGFINSSLYLTVWRDGDLFLERIDIQPGLKDEYSDYTVHLDRRMTDEDIDVTSSYDALLDHTTFTLPFPISTDATVQVMSRYTDVEDGGTMFQKVSQGASSVVVTGDRTVTPVWIGEDYTMTFEMSDPVLKTGTDSGGRAILATGRLQVLRGFVVYSRSKYFTVEVTPRFRDTYTYTFTGRPLGTGLAIIGSDALEDGTFRFPIMSKADNVTVTLKNDSPFPSALLSVDWESQYTAQSQRFQG